LPLEGGGQEGVSHRDGTLKSAQNTPKPTESKLPRRKTSPAISKRKQKRFVGFDASFPPPPLSCRILSSMKCRSITSLCLICDVAACQRLHLALGFLAMAVRRFLPKYATRPPSPEGIAWITAWQAGCERLLRWVIARHALRFCGLDPNLAYSA